jgi:hypothetical protein
VTVASDATAAPSPPTSAPPVSSAAAPPAASAAAGDAVLVSEARVLECHDPGRSHTPAAECDHLAPIEKSFAQAITASGACLPTSAGGGTLVYVADVSFQRHRNPIALTVPRDGRALRNAHASGTAATACGAAVKRALVGTPLEGVTHAHQRYKIAITATYGGGR